MFCNKPLAFESSPGFPESSSSPDSTPKMDCHIVIVSHNGLSYKYLIFTLFQTLHSSRLLRCTKQDTEALGTGING